MYFFKIFKPEWFIAQYKSLFRCMNKTNTGRLERMPLIFTIDRDNFQPPGTRH